MGEVNCREAAREVPLGASIWKGGDMEHRPENGDRQSDRRFLAVRNELRSWICKESKTVSKQQCFYISRCLLFAFILLFFVLHVNPGFARYIVAILG